jgi:hypothetical protein
VISGTQNVGTKYFIADYGVPEFTVRGSNPAVRPIIEPISSPENDFFTCYNCFLTIENLEFHHTWNVSFDDGSYFYALIYVVSGVSLTVRNVTFSSLYPALLAQSSVVYYGYTDNLLLIDNCLFQNIGLTKVPLLYDYYDTLFNITATTFRNILGMNFP